MIVFLDKTYTQKKVVNQSRLNKYIINRFQYFYKKYQDTIQITEEDNHLWILIFSIMIFENYNRGRFKRKLERIKVASGRRATIGIMQIESDRNLTDEESINQAYFKLKEEIGEGAAWDDEMSINYYASRYNPDKDYAKSVAYIYLCLDKYLKNTQKYYVEFHLEEKQKILPLDNSENETIVEVEEKKQYITIDDIKLMTGLSKKAIKKKLKKKEIFALYDEEEIRKVFDGYIGKG